MTGMELYVRFMLTLTTGLAGVGLVLVTLFETLFRDWDPAVDLRRWWRHYHRHQNTSSVRAEDILSELEGRRKSRELYATRPPARAIDRRRVDLLDMRAADKRVSSPEFVEAL
jgi:hypothetical protein